MLDKDQQRAIKTFCKFVRKDDSRDRREWNSSSPTMREVYLEAGGFRNAAANVKLASLTWDQLPKKVRDGLYLIGGAGPAPSLFHPFGPLGIFGDL